MIATRHVAALLILAIPLALPGCALFQGREPLQVTVLGVEPEAGQGLELRMLVKLRIQNPNDTPVDYNGVALDMYVQGKSFATGVSDAAGSVPRFGEAVISVPMTVSAFSMVGEAFSLLHGGMSGKISYEMKGKLHGSGVSSTSFKTEGEFDLPTG